MTTKYPAEFACPQILPYKIDVNMGVLRTPMESGHSRQRRMFRTMPHIFSLEFVLTVKELGRWQAWVNLFAYDYFNMNLESMYSGLADAETIPHTVRFISNLQIENVTQGYVRVRVQAELSPAFVTAGGPAVPTFNWVVAGDASSPAADWIIAGVPANPSLDNIIAGTAPNPAARF
jgi:hypothetical protein